MTELEILFNRRWILKSEDKEQYYKLTYCATSNKLCKNL